MPRLKLGGDVAALNPGISGGTVKHRQAADKAGMFLAAWQQHVVKPQPAAEWRFHPTRKFRFDWAFTDYKLAVEVDGGQWSGPNGGRHNSDRDREKMNLAAALGWRVMHFTPQDLKRDPAGCVDLVLAALQ